MHLVSYIALNLVKDTYICNFCAPLLDSYVFLQCSTFRSTRKKLS